MEVKKNYFLLLLEKVQKCWRTCKAKKNGSFIRTMDVNRKSCSPDYILPVQQSFDIPKKAKYIQGAEDKLGQFLDQCI